MSWLSERVDAFSAGLRERRYVLFGLLAAVVSAADWMTEKLWEHGMVTGIPSWILGLVFIFLVIGWWILEYAVELRVRLTPKLSLAFGQDVVGCVKDQRGEPSTNFQRVVHVNVCVKATAPVEGCFGTLLSIDKLNGSTWERQRAFSGSQRLHWNYYGPIPMRINPGEEHLLHIVILHAPMGAVQLAGHNPDAQMTALVNSPGTFKFNVCLSGSNTAPEYISVSFNKGKQWDKPIVALVS